MEYTVIEDPNKPPPVAAPPPAAASPPPAAAPPPAATVKAAPDLATGHVISAIHDAEVLKLTTRMEHHLSRAVVELETIADRQTVLYQLHCDFWGLLSAVFQRMPPLSMSSAPPSPEKQRNPKASSETPIQQEQAYPAIAPPRPEPDAIAIRVDPQVAPSGPHEQPRDLS